MNSNKPLVLILCGGRALRLWPLSEYKSKNFIDFFGTSPLESTIRRFLKVTPQENIFLVASQKEKNLLKRIKLIKQKNIFFEPESKNTAAAILFSLQYLKKYSENILIVSPVDNLIKGLRQFYSVIKEAVRAARKGGIVTVGTTPQAPTARFGYILAGRRIYKNLYSVKRFIEKPSIKRAKKLIKGGNALYNSGMFISSIGTFNREYKKYYPYYKNFAPAFIKKKVSFLYRKISDVPFDKAVMEKSKRIRVVKGNFSWKDFGNWQAVYEILPKDKRKNVKSENIFIYKGKNNFIYSDSGKKKILALGINNIFFVDTDNYTLIAHPHYLDKLKLALKELKKII